MTNPWKLATIALSIAGVTALAIAFTTAQMLKPAAPLAAEAPAPVIRPAVAYTAPAPPAAPAVRRAVAHPVVASPRVTPVAAQAPPAAECASGTDRAMRIAKPGVLGTLLGAGLGAAGGAVADGGKGAGKGALIGGLAGAALGTGYGAYKTKNECGTIFGNGSFQGVAPDASASTGTPTPAMQDGRVGGNLDVYHMQ
jgi:hypothetical protein